MSHTGRPSRRAVLRAAGAVALGGVAAGAAGCGEADDPRSKLPDTTGEVGVVRRLIALEDETAAVYEAAIPMLRGPARRQASLFLAQEREHAARLRQALRTLKAQAPAPKRGQALPPARSGPEALTGIVAAENRAVRGYLDALPKLTAQALRLLAGAILAAEAEHLAAFALGQGGPPAPAAFVTGEA